VRGAVARFLTRFAVAALIAGLTLTGETLADSSLQLDVPDGTIVTIFRDVYGAPHIIGESDAGVFFGQGFAVAQDRLYQLELNRRAAEGRLSEWFGPLTVEFDREIRRMYYTEAERMDLFRELPPEFQEMLVAYRDGINAYVDSMNADPARYKPIEFAVLEMEPWTVTRSIAVIQFITRGFGQAGGNELTRLVELQSFGREWFDLNRPINDPTAPTTIPGIGPGTPRTWRNTGIHAREELVQAIEKGKADRNRLIGRLDIPGKLGSFAVAISGTKSNSGNVMMLGAPQMGPPQPDEPNVAHEVELDSPTFHVGGMTIAGIPLVIVGHTPNLAWSLTRGLSEKSEV
jgi:penicillin amidase